MAGIWHFLPGVAENDLVDTAKRINRSVLERFGLADVLRDVRTHPNDLIVTPLRQGPGGQSGLLCYPTTTRAIPPDNPGYDAEKQLFLERGSRWLGYLKDEPIRPDALERRRVLNGYFVLDRSGNQWVVPTLRGKDNDLGALPVEFFFGDGPLPTAKIAREYHEIWQDGKRVWDHLKGINEETGTWLAKTLANAMALNYRLGDDELWLLDQAGQNLMDVDFVLEGLNSMVDFAATEDYAAQKKRLTSLIRLAG